MGRFSTPPSNSDPPLLPPLGLATGADELLGAGSALQQHIEDNAARLGRRLKLRVRLPSFEAVCRVVENGIGLAIVPATAARTHVRWIA